MGPEGGTGPTGATGSTGAMGLQGSTGTTGAPPSPFASVTTEQNPDGSTSTTYTQGSYFDRKPYYSFTDTTAADGTLESEVRDRNNGATTFDLFTSGQTQTSVYYDRFNILQGSGADTFVFTPGHGSDVVNGFATAGANHDVLSFAHADFGSIAAVLRNTQDTGAGALISDPGGNGDTVLLTGIAKADLAAHARADLKLHG